MRFCEIICVSCYVAPVKEIRKYGEFLLLKVAGGGFGTLKCGWKYSIENDGYYNAFAALQFQSVNSAHIISTVTLVFSGRTVSEI